MLPVEPIYGIILLYHVTSRDVRKLTIIRRIFGIRVGLRIFRRRKVAKSYIVGTLTNKANISILYYSVPYRLSTDSKTLTLNDLEWPFCVKLCFVPVCLEL